MVDDYFHHEASFARASATSVETSNIVCALQRLPAAPPATQRWFSTVKGYTVLAGRSDERSTRTRKKRPGRESREGGARPEPKDDAGLYGASHRPRSKTPPCSFGFLGVTVCPVPNITGDRKCAPQEIEDRGFMPFACRVPIGSRCSEATRAMRGNATGNIDQALHSVTLRRRSQLAIQRHQRQKVDFHPLPVAPRGLLVVLDGFAVFPCPPEQMR
jgi:hypothetical protein